jgi:hypothetical protein
MRVVYQPEGWNGLSVYRLAYTDEDNAVYHRDPNLCRNRLPDEVLLQFRRLTWFGQISKPEPGGPG